MKPGVLVRERFTGRIGIIISEPEYWPFNGGAIVYECILVLWTDGEQELIEIDWLEIANEA